MPTEKDILDRIVKQIFSLVPENALGATNLRLHDGHRRKDGTAYLGRVAFQVGGLQLTISHEEDRCFRVCGHGHKSMMTGYPMFLADVYLDFDELPAGVPAFIENLFEDYPVNQRHTKDPKPPTKETPPSSAPYKWPERDRKKNPSIDRGNWGTERIKQILETK